jgi:hypothetical protein
MDLAAVITTVVLLQIDLLVAVAVQAVRVSRLLLQRNPVTEE